MHKIIGLFVAVFALSACGSIPQSREFAAPDPAAAAGPSTQDKVASGQSGLGTVAYDANTRAEVCRKIRKTGSHQYITTCDDPDGGSQPVRYGGWNDLGGLVMSGTVRPENY